MFLLNENHPPHLDQYGIILPVPPERFNNLKNWVQEKIDSKNIYWLTENLLDKKDLLRVHSTFYIAELFENPDKCIKKCFELDEAYERFDQTKAQRPMSELVQRILYHSGGTYKASVLALEHKNCFFVGGGYHHALKEGPSGFCLINDIVIAIKKLQYEKEIKTAWVIDVDAHMGDGVASLTQNDDSIRTFSIHMKSGWPLIANEDFHIKSDFDIALSSEECINYNDYLLQALEEFRIKFSKPDLIIFNQGSDPYEKDTLKSTQTMNLTLEQMLDRDMLLYNFAKELECPATYILSGGYGPFAHEPTINFWKNLNDFK